MQPWGFIEGVGYVPAIAAVRTAVDAGTEAARSVGQVHCAHVIALPSEGAEKVLSLNIAD